MAAAACAFASSAMAAPADGGGAGPWVMGGLAVLAAGAAGYALGSLRTERRLASATRAAVRDTQATVQLLDGWHWQTDAAHTLVRLDPSPERAGESPPARAGAALWQCFDDGGADAAAGLKSRLESRGAFAALRARAADGSWWLLRGAPRFDESGAFAGHAGVARPLAAEDTLHLERAAFDALLEAGPGPAVLVLRDAAAGPWRVVRRNAAAAELLGLGPTGLQGPDGAAQLEPPAAALPHPLHELLAQPAFEPGARLQAEGWCVRLLERPPGCGHAALAWRPGVAGAGAEPGEGESLTFTVSHDLRAPIRVVEGFTRIVKEDYGRLLDRVGNDHLDRVLGAAARMNQMIDAMLGLARLSSQPLAHQPVNLSQLAGYVIDDLRRNSPERGADITIEPGMLTTGDPTLLRLVLENLLGNAWKYTSRTPRPRISFGIETLDGRRVYVVRDNGAGFDMRSAERLFGLFQRLHSQSDFPGTGVGLASTRRIVRRHGGEIWAEGQVGRGSAFFFTLAR